MHAVHVGLQWQIRTLSYSPTTPLICRREALDAGIKKSNHRGVASVNVSWRPDWSLQSHIHGIHTVYIPLTSTLEGCRPTLTGGRETLMPSHSVGLPSHSAPCRPIASLSAGLPSHSVGLPSHSVGLPSISVGLPSISVGLPSLSVGLPSLSVGSAVP